MHSSLPHKNHSDFDAIRPLRPVPKCAGVVGVDPAEWGPRGVDHQHWAYALILQDCIAYFDANGKEELSDDPSSAERLRACWNEIQTRKNSARQQWATRFYFRPISVPEFHDYRKRYRACGNHLLALVPQHQWQKPADDWDDHVFAITLIQSIELPHPKAKRGQQSFAFAADYIARSSNLKDLKPSEVYRGYKVAVAAENQRREERGLLPLTTFDRRLVERIPAWFPQLVASLTPDGHKPATQETCHG
ncbi:hypothetical protein [Rhizobium mongolense]|uniref:Uncharacterized protein n=2 Tax=Rhizobium mongolense TaxID=57676 RepID=A0ABR6IWQ7_9HYPH|nr:hypothetical protein [Rhizobium mongolense]MBB4232198.1 hypothetical protein [Rhizobium mongolense]TVZ63082.1 hypothetical protein BCL32_3198 [Rhizobium mongolense USDA 1844]